MICLRLSTAGEISTNLVGAIGRHGTPVCPAGGGRSPRHRRCRLAGMVLPLHTWAWPSTDPVPRPGKVSTLTARSGAGNLHSAACHSVRGGRHGNGLCQLVHPGRDRRVPPIGRCGPCRRTAACDLEWSTGRGRGCCRGFRPPDQARSRRPPLRSWRCCWKCRMTVAPSSPQTCNPGIPHFDGAA